MKMNYNWEKVVSDVRSYLDTNKLTYTKFSKESGVDAATISKMMRLVEQPSVNVVRRISKCIGTDVEEYMADATVTFNNDINVKVYIDDDKCYSEVKMVNISKVDDEINRLKKHKYNMIQRNIKVINSEITRLQKLLEEQERLLKEEA